MSRELIKQSHAPYMNCCACVAAMMTGHRVEEVHEWLGNEPGESMHDAELIVWAIKHGFMPFMEWRGGTWDPETGDTLTTSELDHPLHKQPLVAMLQGIDLAYVAVQSQKNPKYGHAVLWADQRLYDPAPYAPNEPLKSLEGYRILSIFPFIEQGETPKDVFQSSMARLQCVGPYPAPWLPDSIRQDIEAYGCLP